MDEGGALNFRMGLAGSGGGHTGAGGTPLAEKVTAGFDTDKPMFGYSGMDNLEKKIQSAAFVTAIKFFDGLKSQAQTVSLQSVSLFQTIQPPKATPNMPAPSQIFSKGKGGGHG